MTGVSKGRQGLQTNKTEARQLSPTWCSQSILKYRMSHCGLIIGVSLRIRVKACGLPEFWQCVAQHGVRRTVEPEARTHVEDTADGHVGTAILL